MPAVVITAKTASKLTSAKTPVLMFYHMTSCGHCAMFMPTWKTICATLASNKDVMTCQVEYSQMTALPTNLQNVMMFPTIRMISDGKTVGEYNGMRTQEDVLEWTSAYIQKASKSRSKSNSASASAPPKKKARKTA